MAISPDGRLLHAVVGRYDLRTWDALNGDERPKAGLPFLRRWVGVFDDGRVLSVATGDNSSQVLDLEGGFEQQKVSHDADITCHDLDEAAGIFVTGSLDGTVFVWNALTCSPRCRSALHDGPSTPSRWTCGGKGAGSCHAAPMVRWYGRSTSSPKPAE